VCVCGGEEVGVSASVEVLHIIYFTLYTTHYIHIRLPPLLNPIIIRPSAVHATQVACLGVFVCVCICVFVYLCKCVYLCYICVCA
jgi:hypothetical protein